MKINQDRMFSQDQQPQQTDCKPMSAFFSFLKKLTQRFFQESCSTYAASLTFTTLLSIVPITIFIFYILSFFPALQFAGKKLELFAISHFVAGSAHTISEQIQHFVANAKILSWEMVASLVFVTLLMIFNIVMTINSIWHTQLRIQSAISFVFYFIALCIAPILFALLLLFSSYLTTLPLLSHFVEIDLVRKPLISLSPFLIEWIVFTLFHWLMPSCRVYFRYAVLAGLVTTILFEIAKWGFVLYFHYFSTYQFLYGALAAIPIFFLWVYISWLILMIGALFCRMMQVRVDV